MRMLRILKPAPIWYVTLFKLYLKYTIENSAMVATKPPNSQE
jgi:hypothetical protein